MFDVTVVPRTKIKLVFLPLKYRVLFFRFRRVFFLNSDFSLLLNSR